MPHGFVQQRLVYGRAKDRIGQVQRAYFLIAQIDDIYAGHDY
jgi:hypothetical protein